MNLKTIAALLVVSLQVLQGKNLSANLSLKIANTEMASSACLMKLKENYCIQT